jgi:hypothetical protein
VDTSGFHFFDKQIGLAIGHPDITDTSGDGSDAAAGIRSGSATDTGVRPPG